MRHRLQTRILCEGANGPCTSMADDIVDRKGIFVIPDILANAGGVQHRQPTSEWVQDRQGFFWSEKEVNDRLKEVIERSFEEVVRLRGDAQSEQSGRRLHAGDRPCGLRAEGAWYLCMTGVLCRGPLVSLGDSAWIWIYKNKGGCRRSTLTHA